MPDDTASVTELPYRQGVGIMLLNRHGRVWLGRRCPKWQGDKSAFVWQMPQGGIAPGEPPALAALRELEEETGITRAMFLGEMREWLTYDLPSDLLGVALKGRYRGQRQRWFAMRFLGEDSEVRIEARNGHKQEFDAWRWADLEAVPREIVAFKRPLYEKVVAGFAPLVGELRDGHVGA